MMIYDHMKESYVLKLNEKNRITNYPITSCIQLQEGHILIAEIDCRDTHCSAGISLFVTACKQIMQV